MSVVTDLLFDTFRDGEWFIGIVMWILFGLICLLILGMIGLGVREHQWSQQVPVEIEATLISTSYSPSTLETHVAPVIAGKGAGAAVYTTGSKEKPITIWKSKKYGTMICENKRVFQFQPAVGERATLMVKFLGDEFRIVGIKEPEGNMQ